MAEDQASYPGGTMTAPYAFPTHMLGTMTGESDDETASSILIARTAS